MNFTRHFNQLLGFLVLAFSMSGLLVSNAAHAAQCKGLSMSKCESAADCSWVKSYTTSKGAKVDAYCRAKPSKASKKSSPADTGTKKTGTAASASVKDDKKSASKKKTETKEGKTKSTEEKKAKKKSEKTDKKTDSK